MSPSVVPAPLPATDPLRATPVDNAPTDVPARISAYYSLVFPNITFFLQTLTVTIGRRCLPPATTAPNGSDPPAATHSPVDVDLGPLKSVSRLHARIEYEEEEARFVLVVIGRNGAWVDGIWSGAGSRVPLCERSQIQIASRTFHFVLPPPAALEDSPSPSSASSMQRARSPSVDITSISPPSSLPSHSPSPRAAPALPPQKPHSPHSQSPNITAFSRIKAPSASTSAPSSTTAPTSKKRKKAFQPPPKPDVMPPKPPFTYAQLCYRAIKGMGGKATLQDICGWMMDNYDWYRYNGGAGWENSVRHNLSSGRAFKKMERSTGEHGKGFFWSVDPQYEHTFEEQEARAAAQAQSSSSAAQVGGKDGSTKGSRKKDKGAPLDPPLKRSVKSGSGPLPPPLTSMPLAPPRSAPLTGQLAGTPAHTHAAGEPFPVVPNGVNKGDAGFEALAHETKSEPTGALPSALGSVALSRSCPGLETPANISTSRVDPVISSTLFNDVPSSSDSPSPFAALPPSVCLPIIVGPIPPSHPSSSTSDPPPIVLHDNTLVLSPIIFSSLAPEQLKALEEMGAQKALEVLQAHIVRYLKERMGKKKRKKTVPNGVAEKGGTKSGKSDASELSSPFTTAPLPLRSAQPAPMPRASHSSSQAPSTATAIANSSGFCIPPIDPSSAEVKEGVPTSVGGSPPVPVPLPHDSRQNTLISIVDNEDDEAGRIAKRRKLGDGEEIGMQFRHEANATQISQAIDEDIEIDVC